MKFVIDIQIQNTGFIYLLTFAEIQVNRLDGIFLNGDTCSPEKHLQFTSVSASITALKSINKC